MAALVFILYSGHAPGRDVRGQSLETATEGHIPGTVNLLLETGIDMCLPSGLQTGGTRTEGEEVEGEEVEGQEVEGQEEGRIWG